MTSTHPRAPAGFATLVLLAATAAAAFAVLPADPVAAHPCSAEDPGKSCGECKSGVHSHTYSDGRPYCASGAGDPGTCGADGVDLGLDLVAVEGLNAVSPSPGFLKNAVAIACA